MTSFVRPPTELRANDVGALRVQEHHGLPQDLEWATTSGQTWLVWSPAGRVVGATS